MGSLGIVLKTLLVTAVVVALAGGVYLFSGAYDVGADVPHTRFVHWVIATARNRAVAVRASDIRVPADLSDPQRILRGAGQYASMCAGCHLAPGYDKDETWQGLYPQPPRLAKMQPQSPAKMFWVLKHGLKMSGMPAWGLTHDDATLWDIVAFVEELPTLSPQQYRDLVAKAPVDDDMTQMPMPGHPAPMAAPTPAASVAPAPSSSVAPATSAPEPVTAATAPSPM